MPLEHWVGETENKKPLTPTYDGHSGAKLFFPRLMFSTTRPIYRFKVRSYIGVSTLNRAAVMAASTQLARFRDAMQNVYGSFEDVSAKDLDGWDPPPKSGGHRGRYLWTDAFGVLNFLTLHKETVERKYLAFAESLVKTVHNVLGYARDGRNRLPGATEENPLGGGLRIGKEEATGPDGDGQYHHYLTLWMFALNRLSVATGNPQFNTQAVSLAKAIHPRFFIDRTSPRPRMVWKTAMDMSKPLVASEGNLDPIDGHVIFRLLQSAADKGEILQEEIDDYKRVMDRKGQHFVSNDTLDLGMTLWTSHWLSEREPWANRLAGRCVKQLRKSLSRP